MDRISGSYPGGPKRDQLRTNDERGFSRLIPRVADLERGAQYLRRRRMHRMRRKRMMIAVGVALVVSGASGMYMGLQTHRSPEELAQAEREKARPLELDLAKEANRLMSELWKMEDLDRVPRR